MSRTIPCRSCDGTGRWQYGDDSGPCVDCEGTGRRPAKPIEPETPTEVLAALRNWFAGEVEAGDEALQVWVNRIDSVLPRADSLSESAHPEAVSGEPQ